MKSVPLRYCTNSMLDPRHLKDVFLTALSAVAIVLLCPSCRQKESHVRPKAPDGFASLLEACHSGLQYHGLTHGPDGVLLDFEGGLTIELKSSQIIVEELGPNDRPKTVSLNLEDLWTLDGRSVGVHKEDVPDEDALPVYIFEQYMDLHLFLSNGSSFFLPFRPGRTSGRIPVVRITTRDGTGITSKENYVEGTLVIENPDLMFGGEERFEAVMRIRGRGNFTWTLPKKPYKIKLDKKARLFDMSTDKEWCLLANLSDRSMLRNITAMEISRRIGFKWTPRMVPVEVWLNGAYEGVYTFCEHKKVSPERIDIDIEGGDILFELDQNQDKPVCWWTSMDAPMMFSDPDEPTQEQTDFAKDFFQGFEDALRAKDYTKAYGYIDAGSFIDNFIIQELTKNVDGNLRKSTYLTLKKGGKLEMYFVWDFDTALGNCSDYGDGMQLWEGWWTKDRNAAGTGRGWYHELFMDPSFVSAVKARWEALYPELLTIPGFIMENASMLEDVAPGDFERWDKTRFWIWPGARFEDSYAGEVGWLKEYYLRRLDWISASMKDI